jgi:hypothetical protein
MKVTLRRWEWFVPRMLAEDLGESLRGADWGVFGLVGWLVLAPGWVVLAAQDAALRASDSIASSGKQTSGSRGSSSEVLSKVRAKASTLPVGGEPARVRAARRFLARRGLGSPTLATKTKAWRGWGTQGMDLLSERCLEARSCYGGID